MVKSVQSHGADTRYETHANDDGGPSDFRTAIRSKEFPYISGYEKAPDFKNITKLKRVDDVNIQLTFKNDDGKETKRLVVPGDHQYPDVLENLQQFEEIEEHRNEGIKGTKYEVIKDLDKVPDFAGLTVHELHNKNLNDRMVVVDYTDPENGTQRHGIFVKDVDEKSFDNIQTAIEKQSDQIKKTEAKTKATNKTVEKYGEKGYSLAMREDQVPSFDKISNIKSTSDDGILTYNYINADGKKKTGFVFDRVSPDAFDKVKEMKSPEFAEKWNLDKANKGLEEDDKEYVTVAKKGNYFAKAEEAESYFVEENAWMDVEPLHNMDDALLVTHYDNDDRDTVRRKQIVYRDDIGEDKFNKLTDVKNTGKYLDFFENHATQGGGNGRIWTKSSFKGLELWYISRASTAFVDRGFIIVEMNTNGFGPYAGQTIVFSEHKTPEAFGLVRDYVNRKDTSEIDLKEAPGSDDWINLRDKREFPS